MRQIRVGILHNGLDSSVQYAEEMQGQITDESVLININENYTIREALPIRAVPNVMVCLFCEGLEEYQEVVDIINQLDYIKQQDETLSALSILGVNIDEEAANNA